MSVTDIVALMAALRAETLDSAPSVVMARLVPRSTHERSMLRKFVALTITLMTGLLWLAITPPARAASASGAAAVRVVPEYRLGSGDKIRVITFGENALTGEFLVSGSGKVSLPLIGEVQAQNLTIPQFQTEVEDALKHGYLNDPRVSVEVLTFRPFYILGEVNKPGEYAYTDGLTVMNAVATASGFTYRANGKKVFIKRAGETDEHAYPLTGATPVAPGDTIRIGERFF